jgi:hypothetical protein
MDTEPDFSWLYAGVATAMNFFEHYNFTETEEGLVSVGCPCED